MKLSVVIPAYNEANNLPETLDGIVATSRAEEIPFEIVVVFGGTGKQVRDVLHVDDLWEHQAALEPILAR